MAKITRPRTGTKPNGPLVIEVDHENTKKDVKKLDIKIPVLTPRFYKDLTVQDKGSAEIRDYIKLKNTRPFVVEDQSFIIAQKSVFNKIVGDNHFELLFASFLERCEDIISYTRNYSAVNFKIDYVNADGDISDYYPDFIVKVSPRVIYIVETKGAEDLDVPLKMERLKKWREDVNTAQKKSYFGYIFVEQEEFERYSPRSFIELIDKSFIELIDNFRKTKTISEIVDADFFQDLTAKAKSLRQKRQEKISFTAYHPKEGNIDLWHTLLVYTHLTSALSKIQEDVKRFADQIKSPKETTAVASTPMMRGTELTIIPSCEGITFNPERVSFKWLEDFHRADFRFKADPSLSGDAAKGSIDIYVGPLVIGTLKFAMLFNEKDTQPVPDHEEQAKMYDKDDVFISYSRKDSDVARTFKMVLEGTGLDVFLDVDDIRSGQLWENELKRRIERAQIFQIFWSANYSQSENCKQEWEYALKQNKEEGYIRPVFWEKPLSPKPPEELNKFNFKYVELR